MIDCKDQIVSEAHREIAINATRKSIQCLINCIKNHREMLPASSLIQYYEDLQVKC